MFSNITHMSNSWSGTPIILNNILIEFRELKLPKIGRQTFWVSKSKANAEVSPTWMANRRYSTGYKK